VAPLSKQKCLQWPLESTVR